MSSWTRRDMLVALLGAPIGLAACRDGRIKRALPEGELIGPSVKVGHRLRDEPPPTVSSEKRRRKGVVIVGGGAAGLSAAWRLKRAGFDDFLLMELEQAPGGTARSGRSPVTAYPWGAHYIPAPGPENRSLTLLLDEMGVLEGRSEDGAPVVAEQFLCRDPQERVFFRGWWYEGLYLQAGATAEDRRQFAAFQAEIERWVGWRDAKGRRAFTIPIARCTDDAEVTLLDRLTMADYLDRKGFTSPRLRWLADYACRDDYGSTLEQTSAWAGLFYFAARIPRKGAEAEPLITWPEGNGALVNHLYGAVRSHVELGQAVCNIDASTGKSTGTITVTTLSTADRPAAGFEADQVIFAAPRYLARPLLREYRQSPPAHLARFEYGSWLVANLTLSARPQERGFPLSWDNVLYESPSLGYVVATHQRGIDRGPTVLTYYYPFCDADPRRGRERLLEMDRAQCAELALADLSAAHPDIRDLTDRLDVMRWGHAMVRPGPGFLWSEERRTAQRPEHGIHFAHTDLSGVALFEEAFFHGVRAAEEVLAARRVRFTSML
jgi:protoporphyrinogen oxidase